MNGSSHDGLTNVLREGAAQGGPGTEASGAPEPAARGLSLRGLRGKRVMVDHALIIWAIALILIPASRAVSSEFPSTAQLESILLLGLFLVVAGFGQGLVILTGGIDLSVPAGLTLAAFSTAWFTSAGGNSALGIVIGIAASTVLGLVNGIGVAYLRIPAFIMTLATSTITASSLIGINNAQPARPAPGWLPNVFSAGAHRVGGIPAPVFFFVGIALLGWVIQGMTTYGRRVYALGNSPVAARISGVAVRPVHASVYAVAGLFYGIGGVMLLGFAGNAELRLGDDYLLPSIAAVLVGGTAIKGGRGSFFGTIGGVLLLTIVGLDISATGLVEGWKQVLYGVIVLAALILAKRTSLRGVLKSMRESRRHGGSEVRRTG